jgi:hypothetical protein
LNLTRKKPKDLLSQRNRLTRVGLNRLDDIRRQLIPKLPKPQRAKKNPTFAIAMITIGNPDGAVPNPEHGNVQEFAFEGLGLQLRATEKQSERRIRAIGIGALLPADKKVGRLSYSSREDEEEETKSTWNIEES